MQAVNRKVRGRARDERGIAMFLTLILVSTLSVLTVSLMFLSQSESFASGNYRLMTQARYGAEAGVQKAADFILNTDFATTSPGLVALLPTSASPVQYLNNPVVLSSDPAHPSNFPDFAVAAGFQAATSGSLAAGSSTINYTAYATLVSLSKITDGYTGTDKLVQTWQLTSDATIVGVRRSTVEVSAVIDSAKVPTIAYGAFGTSTGCGSLNFQGNVKTNSYDSSQIDPMTGQPYTSIHEFDTGGDVGSNGNLTIVGHVDVKGNMSSPINGVGACTNNGGVASTALTSSGAATVEGGAPLKLPQTLQMPIPPPIPANQRSTITGPVAGTCAAMGLPAANCSVSGGKVYLKNDSATPLKVPFVDLSNTDLVLTATNAAGVTNTYNIDGITMNNGSISVQAPATGVGVKVQLTGYNPDNSAIPEVFHMQAGAEAGGFIANAAAGYPCTGCSQYDASLLQFIYGGTGTANLQGHPNAGAVFYMPQADVTFGGNSSMNGALIAHSLTINGGGNTININYDQSLSGKGQTASLPMVSSFSWKKY